MEETIQDSSIKNLKVCPANMSLAGAEVELDFNDVKRAKTKRKTRRSKRQI